MARLEEPLRPKATLPRRVLLGAAPAGLFVAACQRPTPMTASTTPELDLKGMGRTVGIIAERAAPAALGVGLMNLESGQSFTFNPDRRFPMQSVFKLPLGAAVLAERDAGRLTLTERLELAEDDLSPPHSPIAETWPARTAYTVGELLEATLVDSDNTAADVLMRRIGGPGVVTAWLAMRRVPDVRIDRYERQFGPEVYGMPPFRPAWRTAAGFAAAHDAVPPAMRMSAMRKYMADPRDTATPLGMLELLRMLDRGELLSAASTRLLLELMARTVRGNGRLRAGLPKSAFVAHRPGTSGVEQGLSAAHNDVGLFSLADHRAYALAVFLSGSTLDEAGRDRVIADVAAAAVRAVR